MTDSRKLALWKRLLEHGLKHSPSCLREKVYEVLAEIDYGLTKEECGIKSNKE